MANKLSTSEARHKEALKKVKDNHASEMDRLMEEMSRMKEEIKRLEPFESWPRVLEEEVTKLMADLRVSEQKVADAQRKEKDA